MKLISEKKFNFLNRFRETLTEKEREEIELYIEQRKKDREERVKLYNANVRKHSPVKKKIKAVEVNAMKRLFKHYWEKRQNKKLIIRNENEAIFYLTLCRYFAKDTTLQGQEFSFAKAPIDLNKGLLILGGYGTGKTSLMTAFQDIGAEIMKRHNDTFMWFVSSNCIKMLSEFENAETDRGEFMDKYGKGNRYFDDLGREREASKWGKLNIMAEVLENRLNSKKHKTYLTSNLTFSEFQKKYGGAVFSRMHERLNVLVMDGDDRRKI